MKRLSATLKTDLAMFPVFLALVVTGLGYHISGHDGVETVICIWKILHLLFSSIFVLLVLLHIKQHWVWFRNLFKPFKKKKLITSLLTVVMVFEVLSGIFLLIGSVGGVFCRHLHWIVGILLMFLGTIHIIGHWNPLKSIFKP